MLTSDAALVLVVAADLLVVAGVADVVELGGVLDLVLGERDVDLRLLADSLNGSGRQQNVLAEDPHAGDEVVGAEVVRVLVDLADATVGGLDLVFDQGGARSPGRISKVDLDCR